MNYKINVSKLLEESDRIRYVYLFCTKEMDRCGAKRAYKELKAKFPEPQYKITLERWESACCLLDPEEFLR